jgi:hypothetical protein
MMSTMHPGGSSRRLLREAEQREREDGKEPPVYVRTDYTYIEAPCFGSEDHNKQSAALRRQQRERFHAMSAEQKQAYLSDLNGRDDENAAVAALIVPGWVRELRPVPVATTAAPEVDLEESPEVDHEDDDDPMYVLPRSRKGKQIVRFRG